jgi:hypothetical protein
MPARLAQSLMPRAHPGEVVGGRRYRACTPPERSLEVVDAARARRRRGCRRSQIPRAHAGEVVGVVDDAGSIRLAHSHTKNEGIEQPLPALLAYEDAPH